MHMFGDRSWKEAPLSAKDQPFTEVTGHGILCPASEIKD